MKPKEDFIEKNRKLIGKLERKMAIMVEDRKELEKVLER